MTNINNFFRAKTQLILHAKKLGHNATDVHGLSVLGNHSLRTYVDWSRAIFLPSRKEVKAIMPVNWLENEVSYSMPSLFPSPPCLSPLNLRVPKIGRLPRATNN